MTLKLSLFFTLRPPSCYDRLLSFSLPVFLSCSCSFAFASSSLCGLISWLFPFLFSLCRSFSASCLYFSSLYFPVSNYRFRVFSLDLHFLISTPLNCFLLFLFQTPSSYDRFFSCSLSVFPVLPLYLTLSLSRYSALLLSLSLSYRRSLSLLCFSFFLTLFLFPILFMRCGVQSFSVHVSFFSGNLHRFVSVRLPSGVLSFSVFFRASISCYLPCFSSHSVFLNTLSGCHCICFAQQCVCRSTNITSDGNRGGVCSTF